MADIFRRRTRAEWCEIMEGSDACFAPVLSLSEAPAHPHNLARHVFVDVDEVTQPAPAPRFSVTPSKIGGHPPATGEHTLPVLESAGFSGTEIAELKDLQVI